MDRHFFACSEPCAWASSSLRSRISNPLPLAHLDAVARTEERLGSEGRVLLRPSGTEPVVRVMVEAASQDIAQREAEELVSVVEQHLSL